VIPAIGNAIYDAVGVRMFEVPMTPDRILKAIEKKKRDEAGE
jgi:CO/xanthine dehydrogenase Mo-binding subunit